MISPAPIDPPQIHEAQWEGFSGAVGWDVGANCGQSLPVMLERFSRVEAFEPAWEALEFLYSTGVDTSRVSVWPVALSDVCGPIQLGVAADKIDTGQLVTGDLSTMEWDNTAMVPRTIPGITVDAMVGVVGPPDFLKIDVEGHEWAVLSGARATLSEFHPDLLVEIHSTQLGVDCAALLRMLGYTVTTIRHPGYAEGSQFWDHHYWIRATTDMGV